jgi:hypothetical protein
MLVAARGAKGHMPYPNFVIIGAAKSGTSAMFAQLSQHPDVFAATNKEPRFFAFEGQTLDFGGPGADWSINRVSVTDLGEYLALFEGAEDYAAIGEASPMYLQSADAPSSMHRHIPDARVIAILRNPMERAYSDFVCRRRNGNEPIADFATALRAESERREMGWSPHCHYVDKGRYFTYLKPYFELFPAEQIKIMIYEEMRADRTGAFQSVCEFLDIDPTFRPDTATRYSASGDARNQAVQTVLNTVRRSTTVRTISRPIPKRHMRRAYARIQNRNLQRPAPMPADGRAYLQEVYAPEIESLSRLIGRDLSAWR